MSFREKSSWISMLSMSGIYGFYFWSVFTHRSQSSGFHFGLLDTIVTLVVLQIALTTAIAFLSPKEAKAPRDEREKLIELRSMRVAYAGLATSVALACFFGSFDPPILFNTNALLFILVTAEVLRCACQIVQYRRGA